MNPQEISETLERAAVLIEEHGHCKEIFCMGERICMAEALGRAAGFGSGLAVFSGDGLTKVEPLVKALGFEHPLELCKFNNAQDTTGEIVAARFREAAAKQRLVS